MRSEALQQHFECPRHMASLVAAFVDFQKTQVFFMLTVEVAVILALYNASYLNASSWAQLRENLSFMESVGYSGMEPIVFDMLILRKAGRSSWYISAASACCVLVSSITVFKSSTADVRPEQITRSIQGLGACFDQAPDQYCLNADILGFKRIGPKTVVGAWPVVKWAVSPLIMLVMLMDQLRSSRSTPELAMLFEVLPREAMAAPHARYSSDAVFPTL